MKKSLIMLGTVIALGSLAAPQAEAFDWFGGRLSIGGGYGRVKPKLPYSFQDSYQDGEAWSGHVQYFLNNDFSILASYADLNPYARGNKDNTYRYRPIVGSLRYNLFHHLPFTPYLTAGAGYSINKHETPGVDTIHWDGFTYQAGVGLEFFITEGTSIGAEALYHHFQADGNNTPYHLASLMGTMNIHFGPGPSERRTEEALKKEKADAEATQAALAAQQAAASSAQQQALTAQQQQAQAAAAAAAQAAAQQAEDQKKNQELQAQVSQAQQEMDAIKQMVAHKDISPVTFKTGSADLLATSNDTLNKVAESAKKYPNLKLRVEGHTDNVGGDKLNQDLSQRRADAVKNYLVTSAGVPADQITAVGFGKTRPVASNDTADGRAQNRRVEFIFFIK